MGCLKMNATWFLCFGLALLGSISSPLIGANRPAPPSPTCNPASGEVSLGEPFTLSAQAYSLAPNGAIVEYYWEFTTASLADDRAIWYSLQDWTESATGSQIQIPAASIKPVPHFGYYRYQVRYILPQDENYTSTEKSSAFAIRQIPSKPLANPVSGNVPQGTTLKLSIAEYLTTPQTQNGQNIAPLYRWEKWSEASKSWLALGIESASYLSHSIPKIQESDAGRYRYSLRYTVDNGAFQNGGAHDFTDFSFTSAEIQINVLVKVSLKSGLTNPQNGIPVFKGIDANHTLKFTLADTAKAPISVQWQKRVGSAFVEVPATELPAGVVSSRTLNDLSAGREYSLPITRLGLNPDGSKPTYRVVLSNSISSVISSVTLDLRSHPVITATGDIQPDKKNPLNPLILQPGKNGRLSVTAVGEKPFFYRWMKMGTGPGASFAEISNSNSPSLSILGVDGPPSAGIGAGPGRYRVEIVNAFSSQTFNPATPFAGSNPTQSAEVLVRLVQPPVLADPLAAPPSGLNYPINRSLPEPEAERQKISLTIKSPAPGTESGNFTHCWQKDNISVIALTSLARSAALGDSMLVLPSAAGLVAGMVVSEVSDTGAIAAQTRILSIAGPQITLSTPLIASLSAGRALLLRNSSERLPAGLADSLEVSAPAPGLQSHLIFKPQNHAQAWALQGRFRCLTSNESGSVTSNAIPINVLTPPVILTPAPTTAEAPLVVFGNEGGSLTMGVQATGTPKLEYAWTDKTNTTLSRGPSLTLKGLSANHEGDYRVEIRNPSGSVETRHYRLQVDRAPTVLRGALQLLPYHDSVPTVTTTIPLETEQNGSAIKFRVNFAGTNRLSNDNGKLANSIRVHWLRDVQGVDEAGKKITVQELLYTSTGAEILTQAGGSYSCQFSKTPVLATDSGRYYCRIENQSGAVTMPPWNLIAAGRPSILSEPGFLLNGNIVSDEVSVIAESPVISTSVRALAATPISYQWAEIDPRGGVFPVPGQTSDRLNIRTTEYRDSKQRQFRCILTSRGVKNPTLSQPIYVTVNPIPSPVLSTAEKVPMMPKVARTGERVEIYGANFRYANALFQDRNFNGLCDADEVKIPFTIVNDSQINLNVTANMANGFFNGKPDLFFPDGIGITITTKGKVYRNSGGGSVVTPDFFRTESYENDFFNPTLITVGSNRLTIIGDNTDMLTLPKLISRYGLPSPTGLNAKATYLLRLPSRCSLTILWTGGVVNDEGLDLYTDARLRIFAQVNEANGVNSFLGPDGVTIFEKPTDSRIVINNEIGSEYVYIPDTGSSNQIMLMVDYQWIGNRVYVYRGAVNTNFVGPYSFYIFPGLPKISTPN